MNKEVNNKVIVRYPPSPTGKLHIGNIRTFLFSYLVAKHHIVKGGDAEIYMRFEDTDRERSKKEYEDIALNTLDALGLTFDHGPYRQSERGELYKDAITKLISQGDAYEAEESQDGSGDKVIRFKNPNKNITFVDAIRGEITIDTTDFGDFIIARSKSNPLYHLTVVVDDIDMGVTNVIRGEDHITSTPRQILLIEALGGAVPSYAHLPLIIGSDKKKLGKRHGAVTYQDFAEQGYLPEAIVNYLALLGWSAGDDREFYSINELIEAFDLSGVNKSPAMFSYEKLDSINRHYLLQMGDSEFEQEVLKHVSEEIKNYIDNTTENIRGVIIHTIIKERINKWSDVKGLCESDLDWLDGNVDKLDIEKVVWKKSTREDTLKHLKFIIDALSNVPNTAWSEANDCDGGLQGDNNPIKNAIWDYASEVGRGDVLWPMRYGLTGQERSPDPFTVAFILGKEETLRRLIDILERM